MTIDRMNIMDISENWFWVVAALIYAAWHLAPKLGRNMRDNLRFGATPTVLPAKLPKFYMAYCALLILAMTASNLSGYPWLHAFALAQTVGHSGPGHYHK